MTSIAPSDSESNVSGFINYSENNVKQLYTSMLEKMYMINQDVLIIENNMKRIVQQAGPMESQLSALLQSLPKPNLNLPRDIESINDI